MSLLKAEGLPLPVDPAAGVSGVVVRQLLRDFGPWVLVAMYVLFRLDQHLTGLQVQLAAVAAETGRFRVVVERWMEEREEGKPRRSSVDISGAGPFSFERGESPWRLQ